MSTDCDEIMVTLLEKIRYLYCQSLENQVRYLVELDTVRKTYDKYVKQLQSDHVHGKSRIVNMDIHDCESFREDWEDDDEQLTAVLEQKTDMVCTYWSSWGELIVYLG